MKTTKSESERGIYACLDPRGHTPGRNKVPLTAPRPANLEGKNILVVTREDSPGIIAELQDQLQKQIPSVKLTTWDINRQGLISAAQAKKFQVDAAIVGGSCD